MAFGTGAKIAIGCGCLLLLGTAAVVAVVGVGAWWAKGKIAEATGGLDKVAATAEEIDRWEAKANTNAYVPPADGVIPEARFLKFLDTRKHVYSVYERYEGALRDLQARAEEKGDKLSPSDLWSAGGTVAEAVAAIRLEQMKALAELGMSEREYRDIQIAVYKSAWAATAETESGKLPAEAVSDSMSEAVKQVQEALRTGIEAAQKEGVPGSGKVSEEDVRKLQEELTKLGEDAGQALDVPRANVELFRKHEAEIKKYALHGLAFIGL
jgi:hypothetical protein